MGSYISIGLVYDGLVLEQARIQLKNLISHIISDLNAVKGIKMSRDISGKEWIGYNYNNKCKIDDLCRLLIENYYGQLNLKCNLFGLNQLNITVHIEKEQDYFGFLLDISESELLKTGDLEEINNMTEKIIDFILDLHTTLTYDYAFCDNEAEFQYSPREFRRLKSAVYSIAVIPSIGKQENSFDVIKSNWHINGLTTRHVPRVCHGDCHGTVVCHGDGSLDTQDY